MKYEKSPITIAEQLTKLKERGLQIEDEERAIKYLITIGYYRLSGYMYNMQLSDGSHKFKNNVSFNDIIETYTFDKKLRYLVGTYIERIEVAMRTLLTNEYSIKHGFFWYTEREHYSILPIPAHIQELIDKNGMTLPRKYWDTHAAITNEILESVKNSTEQFIDRYFKKYTSERYPPSNMAMELLSMGKIARLYDTLKNSTEKQCIGDVFRIPSMYLASWLTYLSNIRNICAHHGRLWNRRTTADRFVVPSRKEYKFNGEISEDFNTTFYGTLTIMVKLLDAINPENSFLKKFKELAVAYPIIQLRYMGFPSDWETAPAWG